MKVFDKDLPATSLSEEVMRVAQVVIKKKNIYVDHVCYGLVRTVL